MSGNIRQKKEGDTLVFHLSGRLDASAVEDIKSDFRNISDTKVLLNLGDVSFIDSSGLGLVVSAFRRLRENDGDLALCCLSPQVRTIFELTRLHRVFDIYETEELALASSGG